MGKASRRIRRIGGDSSGMIGHPAGSLEIESEDDGETRGSGKCGV
jgi:hypothetical protein